MDAQAVCNEARLLARNPDSLIKLVNGDHTADSLGWLFDECLQIASKAPGDPVEEALRERIRRGAKLAVVSKKLDSDAWVNYGSRNLICRAAIPKTVIFADCPVAASHLTHDLRQIAFKRGLDKYYADQSVAPFFEPMLGVQKYQVRRDFSKPEGATNLKPSDKSKHRVVVTAGLPIEFLTTCDVQPRVIIWGAISPTLLAKILSTSGSSGKVDWYTNGFQPDSQFDSVLSALRKWRANSGNSLDDEVLKILASASQCISDSDYWKDAIPGVEGLVEHLKDEIEDVVLVALDSRTM